MSDDYYQEQQRRITADIAAQHQRDADAQSRRNSFNFTVALLAKSLSDHQAIQQNQDRQQSQAKLNQDCLDQAAATKRHAMQDLPSQNQHVQNQARRNQTVATERAETLTAPLSERTASYILTKEQLRESAEAFVSSNNRRFGDCFSINEGDIHFKLAVWAEAQKHNIRIDNFEPTRWQKIKLGFSPMYQQPYKIKENNIGGLDILGFDQQGPEGQKKAAEDFVSRSKEMFGDCLSLNKGSKEFMLAVWTAAQKLDVRIENFDPIPELKQTLGFSRSYQQPHKIKVNKNGELELVGFDQLGSEGQKKAAEDFVSRSKEKFGEILTIGMNHSEEYNLAIWAEAQRQGVFIDDFFPLPIQKDRLGFSSSYQQPHKIKIDKDTGGLILLGFDRLGSEGQKKAAEEFVSRCKQALGEVQTIGVDNSTEYKLAFWAAAQKQGVFIENFDPTPEQKENLGFSASYQQLYKIRVNKAGGVSIFGFEPLDPKGKEEAAKALVTHFKQNDASEIDLNPNGSMDYKLAVWAAAQNQGVGIKNFEPTPEQITGLGVPPSYQRFCKIQAEAGKSGATVNSKPTREKKENFGGIQRFTPP